MKIVCMEDMGLRGEAATESNLRPLCDGEAVLAAAVGAWGICALRGQTPWGPHGSLSRPGITVLGGVDDLQWHRAGLRPGSHPEDSGTTAPPPKTFAPFIRSLHLLRGQTAVHLQRLLAKFTVLSQRPLQTSPVS